MAKTRRDQYRTKSSHSQPRSRQSPQASWHSQSRHSQSFSESLCTEPVPRHAQPAFAHWMPKIPMDEMLTMLRSDREQLPSLLENIEEQVGETRKRSQRPVDMRRAEILNRLLELLTEQSPSNIGVLQSTIVSMFTNTYFLSAAVYFFSPEEIDGGCAEGPSAPLVSAIDYGVDDRLVVNLETFEIMAESIQNFELARLLDAYTDYVQAMEVAWQVTALEKNFDAQPRIKSAAGISVWGEFAYISDSVQHMIFRVNILSDEIMAFCGIRGKPGLHDGPREVAKFDSPSGIAICEATSTLYVCDTGNDRIRAVGIPSGTVMTVPITQNDPDVHFENPVGICIVRGEYEYEKEGSDDEDDAEDDANTVNSENPQDYDSDDDDAIGGRHAPLLEGITEEDEDLGVDSRRESRQSSFMYGWSDGGPMRSKQHRNENARYALGTGDGAPVSKPLSLNHIVGSKASRRTSGYVSSHASRRTSGYISSLASRRTSGFTSLASSLSSRRTSTHFSMTPGESAKDSLRECTEEEEEIGYNLAVTSDHCVYLIKPEKGDSIVLAGSPTEYGYKDVEKGKDARFSSLKGITCIRNSLFVADFWNNAIRCINLKTRQVDTVIDFQPCGPIALTVSSSGSVYVLDSEHISVCNILKICSLQCNNQADEQALGTTMFQMIQESIGRARSASMSSRGSVEEGGFFDHLHRRGSAQESRRGSQASEGGAAGSRRQSAEVFRRASEDRMNRRKSSGKGAGLISNLGPRMLAADDQQHMLFPPGKQNSKTRKSPGSFNGSQRSSIVSGAGGGAGGLPVVPKALRSLVPGASLHPALIQMTLRSRGEPEARSVSALTGSQFHVSVVSSVPDDEGFDEGPEFFSFLNPKHETPWKKIPIGTLQYVYQEATGQCSTNSPLTLAYWDASDSDSDLVQGLRNTQQLLVGSAEWPSILKVLPPRKAVPQESGRFRAVAVDVDRVVMADSDSNQIFVVNHTKRTKDKIAGCGKAGYLDGPLDVCRMNQPASIALDPTTHYIYVADSGNHRVRRIDLSTGFMRTVCGNGVKGNRDGSEMRLQSLDSPFDLHFMQPCHLLISCADNSIRRFDLKTSQLDTVLVGS